MALSFSGRLSVTATTWGAGAVREMVAKVGRARGEAVWVRV
jgi:hypothetical protein